MVALVSQQVTQRHTTKHDGKNRQDGDGTEGKERTSGHGEGLADAARTRKEKENAVGRSSRRRR
jgi:hypothetical protein